ncbi:VCBS repeat-containing protein [Cognatiyoonia koreensis]|uniref:VCBS repeat-containing protein n=1 Tax=Cognatiyoonia koreensis TaxID=364200 RepID=A0A1I0S0C9_9RHOB|nr:hypothetical protein [Cognatiyoonia koreensis]SEW47584.1 VCBS repeat-containing protein [Cognatiyoonia koreensis]
MTSETFILYGDVNVEFTITELADGSLQFDLKVLDDTGSIGDLNAFFFDLADDSLTHGMTITGSDVTDTVLKVDGVTKVDNYTNMNGEVIKELGKFDAGVQFGTQGIGQDDIRETSFILSHNTANLSLQDLSMQDIGVRLTSVGAEGGSRDGSLKIGGEVPDFPDGPVEPVNVAIDDTMTVSEVETFNPPFVPFDYLSDFAESILENDQTDEFIYAGDVTAVNGDANAIGDIVLGSNGGAIKIFADGTVDFSAASSEFGPSDFAYLNDGETAQTAFEYTIEGGSTATLTVTVTGISDGGGGPIDDGGPIDFG